MANKTVAYTLASLIEARANCERSGNQEWYGKHQASPCTCCGARQTDTASLWGIESQGDAGYLQQVVSDLLADLRPRKDV